ncbi:MAG: putative nucleotidyltransferase with HDIG domain [Planctomycetota bacterium]|jgi:putative nucleotidyltransferase with HDIG domain
MKPELRKLIGGKLSIPTIPAVVQRINTLMQDPDVGTREIGELISEDAPLAAKVLKIANSAFYGLSRKCISTTHASSMLGLRVLRNIVTQVSVMNKFTHLEGTTGIDVAGMWAHSGLTANIASKLAPLATNVRILGPDEFHVCGLLHDIGKVVMLDWLGEEYALVLKSAAEQGISSEGLEQTAFGFDHQDVGALVATRWDLPEALVDGIQHHHQSQEEVGTRLHVLLVTTADNAAKALQAGDQDAASAAILASAGALGVQPSAIQELLESMSDDAPAV